MRDQADVAVLGAGIVGTTIAYALARDGHRVLLLDRAAPGLGGASFGNAGHIATELVAPLPSPSLLFNFWRELFVLGGPLDIPLARLPRFLPWAWRFAGAAFRREQNTVHLAPLVRVGADRLAWWLQDLGRSELQKRNGHYEIWLDAQAARHAAAHARAMAQLGVRTEPAAADLVETARRNAGCAAAAGLHFPDSAHVVDPLEIVRAFADGAAARGAEIQRAEIRALRPMDDAVEITTDASTIQATKVVVCLGAWSRPLLAPFGLTVPLESANGYHIELPDQTPLVDAPVLYVNERVVVTPMHDRLRATSHMEFSGPDARPAPAKVERLRTHAQKLGFSVEPTSPSWMGARPVLPDYLPAIGKVHSAPRIFYAFGHQHIGLTFACPTAEIIADLLRDRAPRYAIDAFDLRRF